MRFAPFVAFTGFLVLSCTQQPPVTSSTPSPAIEQTGSFYERYELKKGQRRYKDLTEPGTAVEKLSEEKVLADLKAFKRVVENSLINGYLKEDGSATDDSIDLSDLESGVVYISTNTTAEMALCLSRLKMIENSLLVMNDPAKVNAVVDNQSGELAFYYYPEAAEEQVKAFRARHGLSDDKVRWVKEGKLVKYTKLSEAQEKDLEEIWSEYNRSPWQVIVEVKILSVSQGSSKELGGDFGFDGANKTGSATVGSDMSKGQISLGIPIGPGQLDLTIRALEAQGRAFRQKEAHLRWWEHYRDDMKPFVFKKKQMTPVKVINQNVASVVNLEVGLGLTLNKVRVIETPQYRTRLNELLKRYNAWLEKPETKDTLARINMSAQQGRYRNINLKEVNDILNQSEGYQLEYRDIMKQLDISVEGVLEDGGIKSITADGLPQSEAITENFSMLVKNKMPAFVGGTNSREESKSKSGLRGLSKIPLIGWFFGNKEESSEHDSAVAFFTVTILDSLTEQYAAAKYSMLGQRFAIPRELGGFAGNSANDHPLVTGIRSDLFFMYDEARGLVYNTVSRMPYELEGREFAKRVLGHMFWDRIFKPIGKNGIKAEEGWLDFDLIQQELNHLPQPQGYTQGHPFVNRLREMQKELREMSGLSFTLSEIIALARDNGRMGRSKDLHNTDERLPLYMVYLAAHQNGERQVFRSDQEVWQFEKTLLTFKGPDGAAKARAYNELMIRGHTKR